jgi:signal transduction histidine kinase
LFNLLGNAQQALERLDQAGHIVLRAGTVQEDGKWWVIVDIVDDGPGVPGAFIDRIFEPFFTTRDEGTGYGLYLAAELVKEQSGRLTVRNNPGAGVTFTIWLPQLDQPAGPENAGDVSV